MSEEKDEKLEDFDEEDGQELSDEDSRSKLPGDAAKK